jgi:hypothetical protein
MLLQDVFQSFDFERSLKSKDWKTSWSNVRYAQSQKIEKTSWSNVRYVQSQNIDKYPGVTSGTFNRMFFNLLTLSVPDVTPECFSIC